MVLEVLSQLLHGCHVSEQNGLGHSLFDQLDFFLGELSAQEIVITVVEQLEGGGGVEVLLNVLLTIHLADWGLGDDMVPVVVSVMLDIMT